MLTVVKDTRRNKMCAKVTPFSRGVTMNVGDLSSYQVVCFQ